jgi:hypothetical protein
LRFGVSKDERRRESDTTRVERNLRE